jgi:hypothetical protein
LQAAQKATKDAAIADIEKTAANKNLAGSYNALQKDLKDSIAAFKALSSEEAKGAQGKELLKKINETQTSLKATDASMGNYQRNVGNYAGSFAPLMSTFEKLTKTQSSVQGSAANMMGFFSGSKGGFDTFKQGVGLSDESLKVLSKNPIMAIIAILIGLFDAVKDSIGSSSKATNTLKEAMAPLNAIMTVAKNVTVEIVQVFLNAFLAISKFTTAIYGFIAGNDKYSKSVQDAMNVEKERQAIAKANRELIVEEAKGNLEVAKLRDKVTEKDKYTRKERGAALQEAIKIEKKMSDEKVNLSIREYNNLVKTLRLKKELNGDEKTQLAEAQAKMLNVQTEFYQKTRRMKTQAATFNITEDAAEAKAKEDAVKAAKESSDKIIAARRRLIDSGLDLMKEGKEKQIALSNEAYNREIQDLKRNGELTNQLATNLKKQHQIDLAKIESDAKVKTLNDNIKSDELILENIKKSGIDTLEFEKGLLQERKEAEILAGADKFEVEKKYKFMELDLIAKNADEKVALFQKEIEKQAAVLAEGYAKEEVEAKKQYEKILNDSTKTDEQKIQAKKDLEKELNDIKLRALEDGNNLMIAGLEKELQNAELSEDKRLELSNKLTALRIANENAVTDAVIKAGEDQAKADDDASKSRKQIAMDLVGQTMEVFGAIGEFQKQQSEAKIQALEAEQTASDEKFEKDQAQLDGAIMSEENRALQQKALNERKAAADKVIQDKIKAEKIKMAKWDKAQAIIQAITSTALGVMKAFEKEGTLAFITGALIAATGAIQIATIASQPLPAFEHGGVTGDGLALWGEKRAEVAVTPSGDTYLADRPTVSNFDAGTRIYKSVSDYENAMSMSNGKMVEFDYDKLSNAIPSNQFEFDGNGLLIARDKRGSRRTMINRKYTL